MSRQITQQSLLFLGLALATGCAMEGGLDPAMEQGASQLALVTTPPDFPNAGVLGGGLGYGNWVTPVPIPYRCIPGEVIADLVVEPEYVALEEDFGPTEGLKPTKRASRIPSPQYVRTEPIVAHGETFTPAKGVLSSHHSDSVKAPTTGTHAPVNDPPPRYIRTATELECALRHASSNPQARVVYIDDNAEIDLSGLAEGLVIPEGVTLASGRGRNGSRGALLYSRRETPIGMLIVTGTNVRITGLRLRGPRPEIDWPGCYEQQPGLGPARGIQINNGDCRDPEEYPGLEMTIVERNVEIDNNELFAWPAAAVETACVQTIRVHHNHIHHNRHKERSDGCRAYGLGYGVVTTNGSAIIEANVFGNNRHDIASDGQRMACYEARYNLVLGGAVGHHFDVHGGADRCQGDYVCNGPNDPRRETAECCVRNDIAGRRFIIEQNTFARDDEEAVVIRGAPTESMLIRDNRFNHSTLLSAIHQINVDAWVRMSFSGNDFDYDAGRAWFVSSGGDSYWEILRFDSTDLSDVRFADFDHQGGKDAFRQKDGRWEVASFGAGPWVEIETSRYGARDVVLGDFVDGDHVTGVFRITGSYWYHAEPGQHGWEAINALGGNISNYGFGDFDGNGTTDVFMANGQEWFVSRGGNSGWGAPWNTSSYRVDRLRFADFDGNGATDVFRVFNKEWLVSKGENQPWKHLNWNMEGDLEDLRFGDFNGDRRADVFRAAGGVWYVSWSGGTEWQVLNHSSYEVSDLAFADVTGDGRTDVLVKGDP